MRTPHESSVGQIGFIKKHELWTAEQQEAADALAARLQKEDIRRVRIAEAPVVEGAVVAAIQASTGSSLDEVDQAARDAATMTKVKEPGR